MTDLPSEAKYIITTALMGFGHLRAAHNISSLSGAPVIRVDRDPYVKRVDKLVWSAAQHVHTYASRDAESRNRIVYNWFESAMRIPGDHQSPSMTGSRFIFLLEKLGMGKAFLRAFDGRSPALLHTFYLEAMLSVYRGYPGRNYLLLCDTDFHRVWAPVDPVNRKIEYMVPMTKSADRLVSYGVPANRIHVTGFPLPPACTGTRNLMTLQSNFEIRRRRLSRNSTVPLTVMFPFSGAGAYSNVLADLVKTLLDRIRVGRIRLIVSCGDNEAAYGNAENLFVNYGLDECEYAEIMYDRNLFDSFDRFNEALKSVDLMITKPGEIIFYAALGIPMVFLPPIGAHEAANRDYLLGNKCAVEMGAVSDFARWLEESRRSERLLTLAEMGYRNLPKTGTFEVDEIVSRDGV